jgi:hypothetical protein
MTLAVPRHHAIRAVAGERCVKAGDDLHDLQATA